MFRIGVSSCGLPTTEETFAKYQAAGVNAMEISVMPKEGDLLNAKEIAALAKKYGVELWSYHLPFHGYGIAYPEFAKMTVNKYIEVIKKWREVGVEKFILHPSSDNPDGGREEKMRLSKDSLATLADAAKAEGAAICIENLPRTCLGNCSDEILELLSVDDSLTACFDTNHLLSEDPADFVRKVGKRIVTTHVSDTDFINERHWLPGEGKVDWAALITAMKDIGYTGVWMYEIGPKCPDSILRQRDIELSDYVLNANELFAGKNLTVFSTPHPNPPKGYWP